MESERLLVVGASARAAVSSAHRAQFAPWAVDQFCDTDLTACCPAVRVRDLRAGLVAALQTCPEGAWIYTGPLENYPDLVASIRRDRTLWGNAEHALRAVRNPWRVTQSLRAAGVPCPDLHPAGSSVPPGKWIRKPFRSGGGRGLVKLQGLPQLSGDESTRSTVVETGASPSSHVGVPEVGPHWTHYLQREVRGTACSAVFVAVGGRAMLLGATQQLVGCRWAGASPWGYAGSLTWPTITGDELAQFTRIGDILASEFSLVGLFGVDAIVNVRGVWPIEVNPRYTASVELLEQSIGLHAITMHVSACRDATLPQPPPLRGGKCCGKAVLYAYQPLVIERSFHDFVAQANAGHTWPRIADVPAIGEKLTTGRPLVTLFGAGDSSTAVRRRLRQFSRSVHAIALGKRCSQP